MFLGLKSPTAEYLLKQHQKHNKAKAKLRFKEVLEGVKLYGKANVFVPDPQLQDLIDLIDEAGLQYNVEKVYGEQKVKVHF